MPIHTTSTVNFSTQDISSLSPRRSRHLTLLTQPPTITRSNRFPLYDRLPRRWGFFSLRMRRPGTHLRRVHRSTTIAHRCRVERRRHRRRRERRHRQRSQLILPLTIQIIMLLFVSSMPTAFRLQLHRTLIRRLIIRVAHVFPAVGGDFDSGGRFCFMVGRELGGGAERRGGCILVDLAPAEAAACD
jgi:hypothetical protein